MPFYDEAGDGPAVLQLQNWAHLKYQFQPSDFSEAFISPSRELLVLQTNTSEALILPLVSGKESCKLIDARRDEIDISQSSSPTLRQSRLLPFCSDEQRTVSQSNPFHDAALQQGSSSLFESYPVISDAKSLAWGHCGDSYSRFEVSSYKEFLIVSGTDDITVHAFRNCDDNTSESSSEDGDAYGKWVKWGYLHDSKDKLLQVCSSEDLCSIDEKLGHSENINGKQNCSFCTFLMELETTMSDGKYLSLFPAQSSFPRSANVISFSIYRSTLAFLTCADRLNLGEGYSVETLVANKDISKSSETSLSKGEPRGISYKCSKVFSSSSHRLIGLVLTCSVDASGRGNQNGSKNSTNILVVVVMLHSWGIQWVCSVDLQDSYPGSCPIPPWADFQFSGNFLVCLNTSGLVTIWFVDTGRLVAQVDTVQCCEVDIGFPLRRDASFKKTNIDNVDHGVGNNISCKSFKKLVVSSDVLHLAIIDEHGVVYLLYADAYVSEKHHGPNKSLPNSAYADLGILAGWKVAGCSIGGQQSFFGLSDLQELVNGGKQKEESKNHFLGKENQSDSSLNGSGSAWTNDWKITDCESRNYAPMRRIFIPLDRSKVDDCICFSPFGITRIIKCSDMKEQNGYKIVHTDLHVKGSFLDERDLYPCGQFKRCATSAKGSFYLGESLGCIFEGFLYILTQHGLSVVLPSLSVSSSLFPEKSFRCWNSDSFDRSKYDIQNMLTIKKPTEPLTPWQIEVFDRILLFEGFKEAEHVCLENGWDLGKTRLRQMHLALQYLKFDVIEQSLDMLVDVNLAEEGILQLMFISIHDMRCTDGKDTDLVSVSRLLALATRFATKVIRKYGFAIQNKGCELDLGKESRLSQSQKISEMQKIDKANNLTRLSEMAFYLEVIRDLQNRLIPKRRRPGQAPADGRDASSFVDKDVLQSESPLPIILADTVSSQQMETLQLQAKGELSSGAFEPSFDNNNTLALQLVDPSADMIKTDGYYAPEAGLIQKRNLIPLPLENPKDMVARWHIDNFDLKTIVKDALHAGRLPLAVLQLHLQRQQELVTDKEPYDTFNEISNIGKSIAYDLFLKGESALAVTTLQKLGEDIETALRELLFGTVKRSLRVQIAEEMKIRGYLRSNELKTLERISLIERLYPSSSFSRTFLERQKSIYSTTSAGALETDNMVLKFHTSDHLTLQCGDIDGVAIGSWANVDGGSSTSFVNEDTAHASYWACAAAWSDAWDQRTVDRIVLDQSFHVAVDVQWESQFEYYVCHNNLEEIYKLLDSLPEALLLEGSIRINLDSYSTADDGSIMKISDSSLYICSVEDLEPVYLDVPQIKVFGFSAVNMCSLWLKFFVQEELAKKYIFLKQSWSNTAEILPLLALAGFLICPSRMFSKDRFSNSSLDLDLVNNSRKSEKDTLDAFHKLVVHHCVQYNLPYLLDIYIDNHDLLQDHHSLRYLQQVTGDCHWANWMLCSRIKGYEYEASFCNARSNLHRQAAPDSKLSILELDEIIHTVDDLAEGGGEMTALSTLMYAAAPMQKCLCTGSVNRNSSSSSQCTLENLRPGLQQFPTLWRTLIAFCFGQDANGYPFSSAANISNILGKSAFLEYLSWRNGIFLSAGGDTSLEQMQPSCLPKSVRKLIRTFVQGPIGWQSLSGVGNNADSFLFMDNGFAVNMNWNSGLSAISWEASIQKSIEEELYSSVEEKGFGVEHHLHRGRPLAAFNHLLGARALNLKSANPRQHVSGKSSIQSDVQSILAPLNESERSILSSVAPLAIMHFEDPVLVSSCSFFLELCGLSASMLRVDIAALRRISSYYSSIEQNAYCDQVSPKSSAFCAVSHEGQLTVSLARALADDYIHHDHLNISKRTDAPSRVLRDKPSLALSTVLHHLEKSSLPLVAEGNTCGSWLLSGTGDGLECRSKQKKSSQHWSLVTTFCQMHQLPLSTRYLCLLAKDNDWVGFLTEAQLGGYAMDAIIQVAADFSDSRLKIHILTVLKNIQSARSKTSSSTTTSNQGSSREYTFVSGNNTSIPTELFAILADCEKQKNPGEALLSKAKDLRWSLLAIIASCFADVSPLSCLSVWLEITAMRETSCVKMDDVVSKIAASVGAAVESTNSLPSSSRTCAFRYNRRNAKRRCQEEPTSTGSLMATSFDISNTTGSSVTAISGGISSEEIKKTTVESMNVSNGHDVGLSSLSDMVAVLCEQRLFLPLLRAFDIFLPSCPLLPFIRSLQAFSQMRLSEASAHLASFSTRIKEESNNVQNVARDGLVKVSWISTTAVKAADAVLARCPSAYERRCLLKLLSGSDFADGGSASAYFRRLYWKINLAEPSLRKEADVYLGNETLDDGSLLTALENNRCWEQARNWANQLESSGVSWKSATHHVTESQAEAMVAEWKEFLWDVPEERCALWNHCQTLFIRHSFPALQAGSFFLRHAEAIEKDIPARELHDMLLLSLQWLSGTMTQSPPVFPLHILREIETRVWLLAVESEAQFKAERDFPSVSSVQNLLGGNTTSIIEHTASIITKMDNHINAMLAKVSDRNGARETNHAHNHQLHSAESNSTSTAVSSTRVKRRTKTNLPPRRPVANNLESNTDSDDYPDYPYHLKHNDEPKITLSHEESMNIETSVSAWEKRVRPAEMEKAVLSLLEFGQITASKQLQLKLSPTHVPVELALVDSALKLAMLSSSNNNGEISESLLDPEVLAIIQSSGAPINNHKIEPLPALEFLANKCGEGSGQGLCWRIIAVVKAAKVLGLSFSEAFEKMPVDLLQLLSLKAQDSLEEAKLLVQTHTIPAPSIARILAESFLKGLLAAHRGGYMDSQKEEGPAPLLWRFADFLKWAQLCPSEPEIGHALMRLVMTGQEIPHACEVELLILSHHFYRSSACLDGVDVLVTLAANRVESYVSEGDFSCLARLVTGVSNFYALNFILNILIENGQLVLLLQKYSGTGTAAEVRGFTMAVLTALKLFNPHDLDALAMVYNHFGMKHETASLLESRSLQHMKQWLSRRDKDRLTEDLLEAMRHYVEAAEVLSTIDAGQKTRHAFAQASLLSLQIRIPDIQWINLPDTRARRALAEQSRFQEALIVAEAYKLNQPSEWAPVLWNLMLKPDLIEQFVAEFVLVLPLQPSMLLELARYYRNEVAARGDQSHFSVWLSPGGLPAEWIKHLGRSFRSLLRRTRDLKLRLQLATTATGFLDVANACTKAMDKVPENAGPLILRKGHGGAYLPLM